MLPILEAIMTGFPASSTYPENLFICPDSGPCLHGDCSPCDFPEKHQHISGRTLDGENASNEKAEV